ncbi:MAG: SH3 domain-containing protein [Desulforhopalus sp.]|nr:SH3 domain-containing protein [Desulforhopalus sp.]
MNRCGVNLIFFVSFLFSQIFFQSEASSQENIRYVSDVLVVNIKDRLEKPYEVVATVQSEDPLKIIEESGNYFLVETKDGKQGWLAKQYVKSELPKTIVIQKLKQDLTVLMDRINAKPDLSPDGKPEERQSADLLCQELQEKLNDAEKYIAKLTEEQKKSHSSQADSPSKSSTSTIELSSSTSLDQLEQTPENYALLISEFEKRGKQIIELEKIVEKKDNQTQFLWFGAGAAVFLIGLLAGKSGNRKKNKLIY